MSVIASSPTIQRESHHSISLLRHEGSRAGPTLVLLHGIGSNAESFLPLMRALDPAVTLIAWDAPGYCASRALPMAEPRPADYALRLLGLLDELGAAKIDLLGHSLGCLFAASFAAANPERVRRLTLCSPALGYKVAAGETLPPSVQSRIDDLKSFGPAAFAEKRAGRLVHAAQERPEVLAAVRRAMAAVEPAGYAQAVQALGRGDLLADARKLVMPVLLVTGLEDVVTPPDNARRVLAELASPIGLREIEACGHALPQEAPDALAAILKEAILG
jgi:pimeloyl-ACP methyl ester carboxylesterase